MSLIEAPTELASIHEDALDDLYRRQQMRLALRVRAARSALPRLVTALTAHRASSPALTIRSPTRLIEVMRRYAYVHLQGFSVRCPVQ